MKFILIVTAIATVIAVSFIFIAIAMAQQVGYIRVYADRVEFDWAAVESCATYGRDRTCRIAWAARQSCR